MNIIDIKNIKACRCSNCGDTYDIEKVFENMTDFEKLEFISNKQTCLRCGKKYIPYGNIYNIDDFVFNAIKTIKM